MHVHTHTNTHIQYSTHAHPRTHTPALKHTDKGRIPASLGVAIEDSMAQGLDSDTTAAMSQSLGAQFARLREEMLLYGFRCVW
jgi:hypothetical protein